MTTSARLIGIDLAISPDGHQIAFVPEQKQPDGVTHDVFLLNTNSGAIRQLTYDATLKRDPAWSPDGQLIAYFAEQDHVLDGAIYGDLHVRQVNSDQDIRLTQELVLPEQPAWSPDGKFIAVSIIRDGLIDIYRVPLDSGAIQPLTKNDSGGYHLSWSPDGRSILFENSKGIAVVSVTSGEIRQLTNEPEVRVALSHEPIWSPDGRHIAFVAQRDGGDTQERQELYIMNADGSGQTRLTFATGCCYLDGLTWFP